MNDVERQINRSTGNAPSVAASAPWTVDDALTLFELPFGDLIYEAQGVHRRHFDPNEVQLSTLLSIKTGGCPEDCGYCAQSARFQTGVAAEPLMAIDAVLAEARAAKAAGASRFCMGAAWRSLKDRDLPAVTGMVRGVKELGLETCMTLGMLTPAQAGALREAGLDYYNHNIDTSEARYGEIITTRTFQDRLDTLDAARAADLKLCCGGILGLGESRRDRAAMLVTLANLAEPPESVPINMLIPMPGTPLENAAAIDPFEFVRTIGVARILMPRAMVRLSAGREAMSDELQALAFLAGANSIFTGEKLLTAPNTGPGRDAALFETLGLRPMERD
ncbi:MAG TPA: biotin synthase BioB [Alphaproteobacteria bacterium]|nr:biotin synthase BioB [Alphaproteobacteria bacterium]